MVARVAAGLQVAGSQQQVHVEAGRVGRAVDVGDGAVVDDVEDVGVVVDPLARRPDDVARDERHPRGRGGRGRNDALGCGPEHAVVRDPGTARLACAKADVGRDEGPHEIAIVHEQERARRRKDRARHGAEGPVKRAPVELRAGRRVGEGDDRGGVSHGLEVDVEEPRPVGLADREVPSGEARPGVAVVGPQADDVAFRGKLDEVLGEGIADDEDAVAPGPPAVARGRDAHIAGRDCRRQGVERPAPAQAVRPVDRLVAVDVVVEAAGGIAAGGDLVSVLVENLPDRQFLAGKILIPHCVAPEPLNLGENERAAYSHYGLR